MNKEEIKLLAEIRRQQILLDKRIARLETLEFSSIAGGGLVEIETITKADDLSNIFTFDNIPQVFLHLALIICTRGDVGNEGIDYVLCRVNNDSGDRYWSIMEWIYMTAAAGACNQVCTAYFPTKEALWYAYLQPNPGYEEGNDPNTFCAAHMWLPNYRNQYIKKQHVTDFYTPKAAGEWLLVPTDREIIRGQSGGTYHETDPITRLDFRTPGLRNFARNSQISLYGIGGTFEEFA